MQILRGKWKEKKNRYPAAQSGFGICRLIEVMRHAGEFEPSKDFLKLYSTITELRLDEISDELVSSMKDELTAYYYKAITARLQNLVELLSDKVGSGIMIPHQVHEMLEDYADAKDEQERIGIASDILFQVSITAHTFDERDYDVNDKDTPFIDPETANSTVLKQEDLNNAFKHPVQLDLLEALVRLAFLPPEWRSLSRVPNDSDLESSPYEYKQQSLIDRWANKTFDKPTPGVSRACTKDPFTLALTTKETAGIDYGRPRSAFDSHYRILCDICSGK